jgi:DNA-directed RNA polymerase specialized sigma subunit
MSNDRDDEHFKEFASALEGVIAKYGTIEDLYALQRKQMTELVDLEAKFRKVLQDHSQGLRVYTDFVNFICNIKKNILDARPYFRERQTIFTKEISGVFKAKTPEELYDFRINYRFILFAMSAHRWGKKSEIRKLFNKISDLRTEIVEINIPLAISRARVFYSRTPRSHLSYLDLIQIACEGLMSGIDKYTPGSEGVIPRIFRSTVLGRIGGNHISEYSETQIHFYPVDKRKIYRANKVVRKFIDGVDYDALALAVNIDVEDIHKTTSGEIADLMSAASCLSLDQRPIPNEEIKDKNLIGQWDVAPDTARPDVQFENNEATGILFSAFERLTIFEQKFLRMKGLVFNVGRLK